MSDFIVSRRDLEFAFQLEELRLIEQVGVLDDRQRARTEHLHGLFDIAATAATEAESRCADLEDRVAALSRSRRVHRAAHNTLVGRVDELTDMSAELDRRFKRIEAGLAALRPVLP